MATGDLDQATAASLGLVRAGADSRTNADSRSNSDAASRLRAADITRKAAALLISLETRLGVRVGDIRARQVSEPELDLLLQVDGFAKAAVWYQQSGLPAAGANLGASFDNVGRILLRSATRVEQAMENATQDRRFADAWASIQANLRDINLNERRPAR
jgi:hypothetical protein